MRLTCSPTSTKGRRGRQSVARRADDAPSRCPEGEILKLKASEVCGLVQLAGPPPPSAQAFAIGEKVKIRFGVFDGSEAVYAGEDKRRSAHALVCLLGRQVMVKIAAHAIAAR
jgi:transcription antitermination factor NusG